MTFIFRRIIGTIPVLILVTLMVFGLIHLIPGDVATAVLGEEATPAAKVALRHELGLDKPLPVQYASWLWRVLHGDLGRSLADHTPVAQTIAQRLPVTIELALASFLVALIIAIPAGILGATRRGKLSDYVGTAISFAGMSIPSFWLGIMLIIFFAVRLGWLPASGYVPLTQDPKANLQAMLLPAVATGFRESAVLMRMLRSSLLEVLSLEYVRTAKAKGLQPRVVVLRHAIRNALIPVVTSSGLVVAGLLGGLVLTETIFGIPGFGRLIVQSIFDRDFITVQGAVLVSALLVILVNLLVDIAYAMLDPRIRVS
ncbi:MAG: ABC transporter permease [Chloroflexota bacterium]|nr:MAG: peptide ABC transporter [Chloroflexota bacterium]